MLVYIVSKFDSSYMVEDLSASIPGLTFKTFATPENALKRIEEDAPVLVITGNLFSPQTMKGIELCDILRRSFPDVKSLLLTADSLVEGKHWGRCDLFLNKLSSLDKIKEAVEFLI